MVVEDGLIIGRRAIADFVGENERRISQLVLDEQLPAWKPDRGPWRAMRSSLLAWLKTQEAKHVQNLPPVKTLSTTSGR
jgi:hypothetical protein